MKMKLKIGDESLDVKTERATPMVFFDREPYAYLNLDDLKGNDEAVEAIKEVGSDRFSVEFGGVEFYAYLSGREIVLLVK